MLPTLADPVTGAVDPGRAVEAAIRAEAAGFDAVYVGDHLLHPRPILESIVTLSVVAASTERALLGPCVLLVALREPLSLAKQLSTLAAFAPGRVRVGVGVGGDYPGEFEAAGVPLARRGQLVEERLARLRALMEHGTEHGGASLAPTAPGLSFFFGGRSEAALRRAARSGDGWIGYLLDPDAFGRRRSLLVRQCEESGRADEPCTAGMLVPVQVGSADRASAAAAATAWARLTETPAPFPERLFAAGPAEQVVEWLGRYAEAGCSEFVLAPADQGPGLLDQVEVLGAEVLPSLRRP